MSSIECCFCVVHLIQLQCRQVDAFPYLKTRHSCTVIIQVMYCYNTSTPSKTTTGIIVVKINRIISNYDITNKSSGYELT